MNDNSAERPYENYAYFSSSVDIAENLRSLVQLRSQFIIGGEEREYRMLVLDFSYSLRIILPFD